MKSIFTSSTSAGLALLLALPPSEALAQAACAPRFADHVYPCVMPSGKTVDTRLEALEMRAGAQEARISQIRRELQEADKRAYGPATELAEELKVFEQRLADTRAMIKRTRAQEAEQQSAQERQRAAERQAEADRAALEKRKAEADRAAQAKRKHEADLAALVKRDQERLRQQQERPRGGALAAEGNRQQQDRPRGGALAAAANRTAAQVETEALTARDVRRSDEEFDTSVAATGTESRSDKDDGLSKFEKALLLGLGAVAVGTILKNGDEIVSRSGDRVVVERDGDLRVLKNDDALLRRPGSDVRTETFEDGSTRTIVTRPDGAQIVTIRGVDGTVLRRVRVAPDGQEYLLFDDTRPEPQIEVSALPAPRAERSAAPVDGEAELRAALEAQAAYRAGQRFSLRQVRDMPQVRALAPEIQLDAVRFDTGSAAIAPEQARSLALIGNALRDLVLRDPRTVLLVEGHTDAVGDATYNLALSDRRAETVALALTEYFDVPPENMIVQGYGESQLKVPTLAAEPANRRAVVRNISDLLR